MYVAEGWGQNGNVKKKLLYNFLFVDFVSVKNIMYSVNTYLSKYIVMDLQSITFYQISSSRSKGACFECFEVQYSVFILELKWCFFNCCFATQTNLLRFYAMTLLFSFSQTVISFEHLTTPFAVQYFSIEIEILSWLLFVFVLYCIIINAICTYIHVYA